MKVRDKCPYCDGDGWYVAPDYNGEAEQVQCEYCKCQGYVEHEVTEDMKKDAGLK